MRHALVIALSALCLLPARPARAQKQKQKQATTFEYTDLTTCARDAAKAREEAAEEEGSDEPIRCAGPGGEYSVYEYYSAYGIHRSIELKKGERTEFTVQLLPTNKECPVARYGNKVEWQLKEGKPFAVIQRLTCYADKGDGPGKKLGEYLVLKGLQGFEFINGYVPTKAKNANTQVRALLTEFLEGR
ncbi:hypothetical protein [Pyxidicoccus sp. MSG2]|uniref:hypothetical protein n=1 Tax=Pyxidicoccus sp. MSG2 TaxID=2996790 RepID=UPI002271A982|nr:hypothetical protein [Pyxidicoccus sp. MSG2]MCY1014170.1 hypothetical protein [Pyxidicoccus sp. MSG2]